MRLITLSFVALLATACGKKGSDKPKATPDDEAFLESLNGGRGVLSEAVNVRNGFGSAGGGDCFILSVGMPAVEAVRDQTAALGRAPGLNDCLIAIHNAASGIVGVVAEALGGQTPTCDQAVALADVLSKPLDEALCVLKHARNQCAADAKKLGAKTELDEVGVYCADDPPSEPEGPAPGGLEPKAPPPAPAPN